MIDFYIKQTEKYIFLASFGIMMDFIKLFYDLQALTICRRRSTDAQVCFLEDRIQQVIPIYVEGKEYRQRSFIIIR